MRRIHCSLRWLTFTLAAFAFAAALRADDAWPRFRGPNGLGVVAGVSFPSQWAEDDYLWRRALPGVGHSSPVVWGEKLLVTSADPATAEMFVTALSAATGEQLWEVSFPSERYSIHGANSFASSTPAVDANHIYILHAKPAQVVLLALSHAGKEVWRREFPPYIERHGFGISPMVVDDMVVFACDHQGDSFVVALDAATGDTRWQIVRKPGKAAYATPCVWQAVDGSRQIILCSMAEGMTAVTPEGKQVWQLADVFTERCTNSPVIAGGLVVCSCGAGGNGESMVAVRPGNGGDVAAEVVHRWTKSMPQSVTPVADGELLFIWHDRGVVSCRDLTSGEQLWLERIGGTYYGSPVLVGGKLYGMSDDGEVVVLAAAREFAELGRVDLGEPTNATPAVGGGRMYLRGAKSLACLPAEK